MTALTPSARAALAVALVGLLILQLALFLSDRPKALLGPLRHHLLPSIQVERLRSRQGVPASVELGSILEESSGCTVLVVMSHNCPTCRQMRWSWQERFLSLADSLTEPLRAYWLFDGDPSDVAEFLGAGENADITILRMAGDPGETYQKLGVVGTPLTYVLSDRGTLRFGILGDRMPSVGEVDAYCR